MTVQDDVIRRHMNWRQRATAADQVTVVPDTRHIKPPRVHVGKTRFDENDFQSHKGRSLVRIADRADTPTRPLSL